MKPNQTEERVTASSARKGTGSVIDEENIRRTSNYIRHSWKGRALYKLMHLLLFIEGCIWSLMDVTRAARMRIAAKISNHNHNDRV